MKGFDFDNRNHMNPHYSFSAIICLFWSIFPVRVGWWSKVIFVSNLSAVEDELGCAGVLTTGSISERLTESPSICSSFSSFTSSSSLSFS